MKFKLMAEAFVIIGMLFMLGAALDIAPLLDPNEALKPMAVGIFKVMIMASIGFMFCMIGFANLED